MARNSWILLTAVLLGSALALLGGCDEKTAPDLSKDAAAFEGGDPLPTGAMKIMFPWTGKQSIMCIGEQSIERQVAFVDFGTEDNEAQKDPKLGMHLGSVNLDAKGNGTGGFIINATQLRSGDSKRDEKLMGGAWLDAESNPTLRFEATKMTRLKPTVWHIEGNWTMRGITNKVAFFANARFVPKMKYLGENIARIKGGFAIDLKEFGMDNGTVGSPACSAIWNVDVVLLGLIKTDAAPKPAAGK